MTRPGRTPRIGLALGGGSARGWAHIGVLTALEELDIRPHVVCGTSIGALVGGIYAAGRLHELSVWVANLGRRDVLGLVDLTFGGGGVIGLKRLMRLYRDNVGNPDIDELDVDFAAVATDLDSWAEVWLRSGPLLTAIRASIALPGFFTPVRHDGRWLVDGGLVNPVPVAPCRALGADVVIAVDLHAGAASVAGADGAGERHAGVVQPTTDMIMGHDLASDADIEAESKDAPAFGQVVVRALDIMQYRIGRSRLAGDPPDLLLAPLVHDVHPLAFSDGQPTIDEGYASVKRMAPALRLATGRTGTAPTPTP